MGIFCNPGGQLETPGLVEIERYFTGISLFDYFGENFAIMFSGEMLYPG